LKNAERIVIYNNMLNYDSLQNNETVFLSVTSVTVFEFQVLLIAFAQAFEETAHRTVTNEARWRKKGGGQLGKLPNLEAKLLFILSYIKNYPLSNVSRITVWVESIKDQFTDSRTVAEVEKSIRNTRLQA
jgi:hypothetical protein